MMRGSKELAGSRQARKGPCLLCEAVPRECHRQIRGQWQLLEASTVAWALE